jgi:predicted PurR-regulated permease PerM
VITDHRPSPAATALIVGAVIACLYFARTVLIPFALATLLCFLLAPLVVRLRRWNFGRVPSVLCVVVFALAVVATIGGLVWLQLSDLAHQMPAYQQNIEKKIHSIRDTSSGVINHLARVVHDLTQELAPPASPKAPGEVKPVPVEIHRSPFSPLEIVPAILGSVFNVVLTAGMVMVFVTFMLLQREDLRDRLIRLVGAGRINATTQALDDATHRVSRYLLAQCVVNAAYGILVGIGLYFMKVPNPVLWAAFAAIFRYVPYLGIWFAAMMPAGVALATSSGWLEPLGIFVLYFVTDLFMYNAVEPVFYRNSTGISPLAILAAAVFWTWLWGPIGLLLSTPLTVCLVVIGRHVRALEFLAVLLGDEPVLTPEKRFYQRLLAMHLEEATGIAEHFLKEHKSLEELYDQVIVPALVLAEEDRHRGRLDEARQEFVLENTRFLVEDMFERADGLIAGNGSSKKLSEPQPASEKTKFPLEVAVLSMPARDEADEIGALMLAQLLNRRGIGARPVSAEALASERLEEAARERIQIVAIAAVPPFGYMHARYLARRLRTRLPGVKIVAAVLNEADAAELARRQPPLPADAVATGLHQAVTEIFSLVPVAEESAHPASARLVAC